MTKNTNNLIEIIIIITTTIIASFLKNAHLKSLNVHFSRNEAIVIVVIIIIIKMFITGQKTENISCQLNYKK